MYINKFIKGFKKPLHDNMFLSILKIQFIVVKWLKIYLAQVHL
jgi:hypothetical protein